MNKDDYELIDLHYILYGFYKLSLNKESSPINLSMEITEISGSQQYLQNESKELVKKDDSLNLEIFNNISVIQWNSALILIENVINSLDDLIYNNGIVYKILLNSFINSQSKTKSLTSNEMKVTKPTEAIDDLLSNLKRCRNRREKKIILAQFNNQLGIAWGENKKIMSKEKMNETNNDPLIATLRDRVA